MRKFSLLLPILLMSAFHSGAQTLTMETAIGLARDSTVTALISSSGMLKSKWEYQQYIAGLKPQISFSLIPGYQRMSFEPSTYYFKSRNYDMLNTYAEVRLEQKALGIGGEFYASTGAMWTRYFNQSNPLNLFSTVPVGIGYSNSLIAYNPHKWDRIIADLRLKTSEKQYRYDLDRIALEAVKLYIDCYVADSRNEICSTNAQVASKLLEIGREKFGMAAISKNELSALELQSLNAENAVFNARQQLEDSRKRLLSYLKIADSGQPLELSAPPAPVIRVFQLDKVTSLAMENDPGYVKSREDIASAQQNFNKAKVEGSFLRAGVDVNVGIQSSTPTIDRMYAGQQPFVIGGVTLKIPIYDGGLAKSRKKAAQYNLARAEASGKETERVTELNAGLALKNFNIQQDLLQRTERAIRLADESFELAKELYSNGDTDINTFILAQNRKDEAHNNYLNSLKNYWVSYYTLRMLCGPEIDE